jgi:hypothetical protein
MTTESRCVLRHSKGAVEFLRSYPPAVSISFVYGMSHVWFSVVVSLMKRGPRDEMVLGPGVAGALDLVCITRFNDIG